MTEYIHGVRRGADAVRMSHADLELLALATFRMIQQLRIKLARQNKIAWLNGQWSSGPFLPISGDWDADGHWAPTSTDDNNCSTFR
jgi:hypothetical protein